MKYFFPSKQVNANKLVPLVVLISASSLALGQGDYVLEEIVVSARKIEESLQDSPLSIQAFSSHGLESRAITDISQISEFTPNMKFDRAAAIGGSNSTAVVYIRGIGQESGLPTIDQGVGMYIDGVYMARAVGGVFDLVDVERIEVVRGPQGTLFGRNTIGGAISIVSKKPDEDFSAAVSASVGTDSLSEIKFAVNGALSDKVYASASLLGKQRDGYVVRPDGTDFGDEDLLAGRVALHIETSERLLVDFAFDATTSESNGAPFELVDVNPAANFIGFHNNGPFSDPACNGAAGVTSTNSSCYNSTAVLGLDRDNGGLEPEDELDAYGISAIVEYEINDSLRLKSITAYRDSESDFNIDQDHSPAIIAQVSSASTQDQFTQEFQLLGDSGQLSYILGVYYFEEKSNFIESVTFSPGSFTSGGANDNDSTALFGQITYDATDALSLTAGLRYTEETKRFTPDSVVLSDPFFFGPTVVFAQGTRVLPYTQADISIEETSPMVNVSYDWNGEFMTYLTYSEGFKSGGFTQRVFPPQADIPSFEPEFADVIELGFKWQLDSNRLRINGAFFTTDYEDLQVISQAKSVAPIVQNAGKAEISGFELDMQIVPADEWLLEASLGYLDAKYKQIDSGTGIGLDNDLVKTPELSAAAGLSYTLHTDSGATFSPRLDYTYSDEYFNNAVNSPFLKQGSYGLVNLSLNYTSADESWDALLYGKNLGDERYISAGFSEQNLNAATPVNLGSSEVARNRGREYGVKFSYHFD